MKKIETLSDMENVIEFSYYKKIEIEKVLKALTQMYYELDEFEIDVEHLSLVIIQLKEQLIAIESFMNLKTTEFDNRKKEQKEITNGKERE